MSLAVHMKKIEKIAATIFFTCCAIFVFAQKNPDAIIGRWIAIPKKNIIVEVFKDKDKYKGKVVWFNDNDDKTKPMNTRLDENNLDSALRNRKVLGLQVLNNMMYNSKSNRWEKGTIYDAKSGRVYNSSASLIKDNTLLVKGFWHFEFIGKDMYFKKI